MTKVVKGVLIAAIIVAALIATGMGVLVGAGIYGWKHAVRAGNEAAAVQNVRTIQAAEMRYFDTRRQQFVTFPQLVAEQMLDSRFAADTPLVDGYRFKLNLASDNTSGLHSFTLHADPESSSAGTKHFYVDSKDWTIRVNPKQPATASDPPFLD